MKDTQQSSLSGQYGDGLAQVYDKNRVKTERHIQEERVFREYFKAILPNAVLDCPIGTCRWFEIYVDYQVDLTGVDLSEQMLAQSQEKNRDGRLQRMKLIKGNILEDAFAGLSATKYDTVVCVRFLNWIPFESVAQFLKQIERLSDKNFIIGITVVPSKWGFFRKILSKIRLNRSNRVSRAAGRADRFNHAEEDVNSLFAELKLVVLDQQQTYKSKEAINYIYLLKKS